MNYNKIKSISNAQGLSMNDLALRLGITKAAVYRMLSVESISVKQLELIAQILNVSPVVFFDDSDIASPLESKELIQALKDKTKLQEEIIKLLREQLLDCKAKVDKKAALT